MKKTIQKNKQAPKKDQIKEHKPIIKFVPKPNQEAKQSTGKTGPYTSFPSEKFSTIKTNDPFSQPHGGSSFMHIYNAGTIPCKINHGSVSMKLQWNQGVQIQKLPYDPILVTCFEGLTEQKHPYCFIAFNVIKDMIMIENSQMKIIPLINKLVWALRVSLMSKKEDIFQRSLQVLIMLSDKVGSHLNPNIKNLVTPMIRHIHNKKLKQKIFKALNVLQQNGGPQVQKMIKSIIPTYSNI